MKQQTFAASETLTKNKEIIDYSGKTIYVGIDVHQKDYQVAKLCNGVILGNHRMKADGGELIKHLKSHYPGAEFKCVYESCSWGFNLQRKLTAAGINCIVVHAADVASTDKEKKRKSDKVDASKLARQLASGDLTPIHVPDETNQKHRNLIRYRFKLVGNINKCKNRVKSLLKFQGIEIPEQFGEKKCWSKVFISWLEQQSVADPDVGMTLALMIEELKFLRQLLLKTEKKLKDLRTTKDTTLCTLCLLCVLRDP